MSEQLENCPFCGEEPEMWDGRGTQAELGCPECGFAVVGIQVSDILEYEVRYAPENDFNMDTLSYPPNIVEMAQAELIRLWNERTPDLQKLLSEEPSEEMVRDACIAYNQILLNQPDDERNQPKAMKAAIKAYQQALLAKLKEGL